MALLNPPEIRLSMMMLIARHLACRRGQRDTLERLIDSVAPPSLDEADKKDKLQRDVTANLKIVEELGLVRKSKDRLQLVDEAKKPTSQGSLAFADYVRSLVLSDRMNTAPWGSQSGARDLTSALAWFLTFDARNAPDKMETGLHSAKEAQERDFGPRYTSSSTEKGLSDADSDEIEEKSRWPISNDTRWNTFQRWACSLGFAWRSPANRLVPDPTQAVRSVLPEVFAESNHLSARSFLEALGKVLPVLEGGQYRQHVESNWQRPAYDTSELSASTTDALERLKQAGLLKFDDRADAPRLRMIHGTTFSHVWHIEGQS